MALSNISLTNTFFEWLTSHNSVIAEINRYLEGIFKTTGNVTITNVTAPGTVALNVANGLIKGDGGLLSNVLNSAITGTIKNAQLQNSGIAIIVSGLEASATVNVGGTLRANVNLSTSVANTQTTLAAAASTVNTVHGIATSATTTAAAAFNKANTGADTAGLQANAAFNKANTACTQSDVALSQANIKFQRAQVINVDSGFVWSNTGTFLAAASNTANTIRIIAAGANANVQIDAGNNAIRIGATPATDFGRKVLSEASAHDLRTTIDVNEQWFMGYWPDSLAGLTNEPIILHMPFDGTIDTLTHKLEAGAITLSVRINGANVTGLTALAVNTTKKTNTATALNTFTAGANVAFVISNNISADTDFGWALKCTRTS